jgi:hypothetical protein
LALTLIASALLIASSVASAAPPLLSEFCINGSAPGQCVIPRGVATNPTSGDIYVADQSNHRIQQFTAWGEFIRPWGSRGSGPGEFEFPQGLAIDSSGDVYVVDFDNLRVQKFDSNGNFLVMFGGEVDKTTKANVCTEADIEGGDTCGAGVQGVAPGFFGELAPGSYIAVGPGDKIYVGDQNRIQVFDSGGAFLESIAQPGTVQSLAIDGRNPISPSLYVTYTGVNPTNAKENVQKLSSTGTVLGTLEVQNPRALATDPSSGDVYVMDRHPGQASPPPNVLRFSAAGKALEAIDAEDFLESTGLAINAPKTCGLKGTDLIAASSEGAHSFIRIYGPPPDPSVCPPKPLAPSIDNQFAIAADSNGATVKAEINPHFWTETTRYFVQYGTGKCSEGGCTSEQPTPPGSLLSGPVTNQDLTTSGVFLTGLSPDTTYHYRFVAKSDGGGPTIGAEAGFRTLPAMVEPGPDTCSNAALRNGSSSRLPDCRAYEMVSPVDKNGGDVLTNTLLPYKQSDSEIALTDEAGQRMTFSSFRSFAGAEGAPFANQYLASREGSGWSTKAISPPRNTTSFYETGGPANRTTYKLFSEDLCGGWFLQDSPVALVPGAPTETGTLYRRDLCGEGGYDLLSSVAPPGFSFKPLGSSYFPEVQGASADGAHSVFRADGALTPDACPTPGIFQIYESTGEGGLRLVSVKNSFSSSPGAASCEQSSAGTAQSRGPGEFREDSTVGAVSEDGSRVYWTTGGKDPFPANGKGDQPGTIYLRDNASEEESKHAASGKCTQGEKACTYEVSGLVLVPFVSARFLAGSSDGTRAFFSIRVAGGEEQLYEFEATEEKSGLVKTSATLLAEGFQGFMGTSRDAQRAYFVSTEALASGATSGKDNLYFFEKGSDFKFVGALSEQDIFGNSVLGAGVPSPVSPLPLQRTSRVSPNGLNAAFISTASLTGFDNADANSGEPDAEAFLYDAEVEEGKGKLICASCNASGVRPAGRQIAFDGNNESFKLRASAVIPGWPTQSRGSRALSDDGRRLFFTSFEALVPRDTNGKADVYEWGAAQGKEECLEEQGGELFLTESSGCLSLISSGQSPTDSEFLDATPEGKDVFFATLSSLVGKDTGLVDVYDARIDGGFPEPPPPPVSCEGEACQSPPEAPNDPTPASSSFQGPGNVKEPLAKKHKKKAKKKKRHSSKHNAKQSHKKSNSRRTHR